jgi:carbohydrate kinase (thermoresistant glucokinase family)
MGVSGCGKSTVGALLASSLRWEFADADWFHPVSNVDKMHSGMALTDEDRWPWLRAVAAWIDKTRYSGEHGVIACSALKRRYRDAERSPLTSRSDVPALRAPRERAHSVSADVESKNPCQLVGKSHRTKLALKSRD